MRENIRVRANTVVNLTLNTLYEAMQWLPAEPRAGNPRRTTGPGPCARPPTAPCCAGLKMARWSSSPTAPAPPRLKARLVATGQEGTFGESGERISATFEDTPSDSRELLARVDFDPNSDAGMESMLGFRQDLAMPAPSIAWPPSLFILKSTAPMAKDSTKLPSVPGRP